jgi:hypothetical protein
LDYFDDSRATPFIFLSLRLSGWDLRTSWVTVNKSEFRTILTTKHSGGCRQVMRTGRPRARAMMHDLAARVTNLLQAIFSAALLVRAPGTVDVFELKRQVFTADP